MKGLMEIQNCAKFHFDSICSSQVTNFQMFLRLWSSHELGHFGGVLGRKSAKIASILLKFAPEVDLDKRNIVLKFLAETPIFQAKNQLFVLF